MSDLKYPRPDVLPSEMIEQGWWQNRGKGHSPGLHCPISAIWKLTVDCDNQGWESYSAYRDGLTKRVGNPAAWNDALWRTKADVVALCQAVEREMGWLE